MKTTSDGVRLGCKGKVRKGDTGKVQALFIEDSVGRREFRKLGPITATVKNFLNQEESKYVPLRDFPMYCLERVFHSSSCPPGPPGRMGRDGYVFMKWSNILNKLIYLVINYLLTISIYLSNSLCRREGTIGAPGFSGAPGIFFKMSCNFIKAYLLYINTNTWNFYTKLGKDGIAGGDGYPGPRGPAGSPGRPGDRGTRATPKNGQYGLRNKILMNIKNLLHNLCNNCR